MIGFVPTHPSKSLARPLAILLAILCCSVLLSGVSGCNLIDDWKGGDQSDDGKIDPLPGPNPGPNPGPDDGKKYPESEYWEALAVVIESGRFSNTDQVVLAAKAEESLGHLSDIKRLDAMASKRQEITEGNRKSVADVVRGK